MTDDKNKDEQKQEEAQEKPAEAKPAPAEPKATVEPAKQPEKKPEKKPEPTGKFKELIKEIEKLKLTELAELVKALEERFGVSAAMPMAAAPAAQVGGAEGGEEKPAKSTYTIHLSSAGDQKIAVIKAVREIRQDLGLKEAKDLVDGAPKDVKADVPKKEAEEAKKKLEAAGATIELK